MNDDRAISITTSLPTPVRYFRSVRAKYLRLTIKPDRTVTVTVPQNATLRQAEQFLRSRQDWIAKHLQRMRERDERVQEQPELSREELVRTQDKLFDRLAHFSEQYDLPYRRAAFRCQKTRWGSCSSQNNISLNINLAFLPVHLQDYILLHELCHIRHKNHSREFWAELDRLTETDAKQLQKELKGYRIRVRG